MVHCILCYSLPILLPKIVLIASHNWAFLWSIAPHIVVFNYNFRMYYMVTIALMFPTSISMVHSLLQNLVANTLSVVWTINLGLAENLHLKKIYFLHTSAVGGLEMRLWLDWFWLSYTASLFSPSTITLSFRCNQCSLSRDWALLLSLRATKDGQ